MVSSRWLDMDAESCVHQEHCLHRPGSRRKPGTTGTSMGVGAKGKLQEMSLK